MRVPTAEAVPQAVAVALFWSERVRVTVTEVQGDAEVLLLKMVETEALAE